MSHQSELYALKAARNTAWQIQTEVLARFKASREQLNAFETSQKARLEQADRQRGALLYEARQLSDRANELLGESDETNQSTDGEHWRELRDEAFSLIEEAKLKRAEAARLQELKEELKRETEAARATHRAIRDELKKAQTALNQASQAVKDFHPKGPSQPPAPASSPASAQVAATTVAPSPQPITAPAAFATTSVRPPTIQELEADNDRLRHQLAQRIAAVRSTLAAS